MRTNLKLFRVQRGLSQSELAKRLNISRQAYQQIEIGFRDGRITTWQKLQDDFGVEDCEMWSLMKKDDSRN